MLANFGAVVFGAIELSISGRNKPIKYNMGICYYLQVRKISEDVSKTSQV